MPKIELGVLSELLKNNRCYCSTTIYGDITNIFNRDPKYFNKPADKSILIGEIKILEQPDFLSYITDKNDKINGKINDKSLELLMLYRIQKLEDFFLSNPEFGLMAVKQNGLILQFIKNQSDIICMTAVKRDGMALQYVKEQSDIICMEAVKRDGMALQYVKDQSKDICVRAIKTTSLAYKYVDFVVFDIFDICMEVVKSNYYVLLYASDLNILTKNNYFKLCMQAIKYNCQALYYINNVSMQSYITLCIEAVVHHECAYRCINQYQLKKYLVELNDSPDYQKNLEIIKIINLLIEGHKEYLNIDILVGACDDMYNYQEDPEDWQAFYACDAIYSIEEKINIPKKKLF
jgi:hypothetical protein